MTDNLHDDELLSALLREAADAEPVHLDHHRLHADLADRGGARLAARRAALVPVLAVAAAAAIAFGLGSSADDGVAVTVAHDLSTTAAPTTNAPAFVTSDHAAELAKQVEAAIDAGKKTTTTTELAKPAPTTTAEKPAPAPAAEEKPATTTTVHEKPAPPTTLKESPTTTVPKETTTTQPGQHPFTANSTYGSCGEEIPYDVYWGTANPGSVIAITSDYGSGEVVVDHEGHWEKKVFFPEAPFDEVFYVTVSSPQGSKQFTMVRESK